MKSGKLPFARNLRTSMTKAERTLWSRLRNRQLGGYKIRRQHVLCGYIVDFFCQEVDLVIEVDGEVHLSEEAKQADAYRENVLQAHGYNIIRFTNPTVLLHTSDVCLRLLQHIQTIERNTQNC